jgi:hypothetical protein
MINKTTSVATRLFNISSHLLDPRFKHVKEIIFNGWLNVYLQKVFPNLPIDKIEE